MANLPSYQPPAIGPYGTLPGGGTGYPTTLGNTSRNQLINGISSPEAIAALTSGGLGLTSSILTNKANAQESAASRAARLQELLASLYGDEATRNQNAATSYMGTFNMDPVGQQKNIFRGAAMGALASQGAPSIARGSTDVQNTADLSGAAGRYLSPDALASGAANFYSAAAGLNPAAPTPNLYDLGFGMEGQAHQGTVDQARTSAQDTQTNLRNSQRDALINSIAAAQQEQQQKQGTPWWKKALGIAGAVGGVAAVPFTGGASLAAVGPSLNYGFGAGSKTAAIGGIAAGGYANTGGFGTTDYFNRK